MGAPGSKEEATANFLEECMHGRLEFVEKYAKAGADVNGKESDSGRTALHKAAFWGHSHVIEFLLDVSSIGQSVNVNAIDFNGDTPLHDAARFGHKDVVRHLMNAGACTHIRNRKGRNPLDTAL